jgi:hypothetical protein
MASLEKNECHMGKQFYFFVIRLVKKRLEKNVVSRDPRVARSTRHSPGKG